MEGGLHCNPIPPTEDSAGNQLVRLELPLILECAALTLGSGGIRIAVSSRSNSHSCQSKYAFVKLATS